MTDRMSDGTVEWRLLRLEAEYEELDREYKGVLAKIEEMRLDAERRERARLLWGIGALGTVVTTLASIIWAYRGVIFK